MEVRSVFKTGKILVSLGMVEPGVLERAEDRRWREKGQVAHLHRSPRVGPAVSQGMRKRDDIP